MIKKMIKHLRLKDEMIFWISFALALVLSFFRPVSFQAIDFSVICLLCSLMLIASVFEKYHLLEFIATSILMKAKTERQIGFFMILTTAVCAMFITNDVALLIMVPITFAICDKAKINLVKMVVLQTMAANIGSSLTPFGNPQNLFLFKAYSLNLWPFVKITAIFVTLGIGFTLILNLGLPKKKISYESVTVSLKSKKKLLYFSLLFAFVLCSVTGLVDYPISTVIVILSVFLLERELFLNVDYYLLGTFLWFFLIVDQIGHMAFFRESVKMFLSTKRMVFIVSGLVSQVISNVPAAVLVSAFTSHYDALLLGVSVGGIGTMIASMANLITYKLYIKRYPKSNYAKLFYLYNFLGFCLLSIFFMLLL